MLKESQDGWRGWPPRPSRAGPAVITDENGVAEIPFAASDVNTEFIGIIEAIDGTGLLDAQTFTLRVIKY